MKNKKYKKASDDRRFTFGKNWQNFLSVISEPHIKEAKNSLIKMLGLKDLNGKRFLDIGCGSGLFSLAAKQLGATVHSFDFDPKSVDCARQLKHRYYPQDDSWTIEQGSVLDVDFLMEMGKFDIVYSWGVLHHTGNLMQALKNVTLTLRKSSFLFIAIYNDQGLISEFWKMIKRTYCSSIFGQYFVKLVFIPFFIVRSIVAGLVKYRSPFGEFKKYKRHRGMSIYHDWIDWLGGYPFEVATPEFVFHYFRDAGFILKNLTTTNRLGCNQFVFEKL